MNDDPFGLMQSKQAPANPCNRPPLAAYGARVLLGAALPPAPAPGVWAWTWDPNLNLGLQLYNVILLSQNCDSLHRPVRSHRETTPILSVRLTESLKLMIPQLPQSAWPQGRNSAHPSHEPRATFRNKCQEIVDFSCNPECENALEALKFLSIRIGISI